MEELWRLAFERMAHELEYPANNKERDRNPPETRNEDGYRQKQEGENNHGNADRMAHTINLVLMAG